MSISTTSGRHSAASRTAVETVGGLPDHLDPVHPGQHHVQPGTDQLLVVDQHHPHAHSGTRAVTRKPGPGSRASVSDRAPEQLHPLPHADEPPAGSRCVRVLAGAVVEDLDLEPVRAVGDAHGRRPGPGVLHHVGERLLDDPVRRDVDRGRQRHRLAGDRGRHLEPGGTDRGDELLEPVQARLRGESLVVRRVRVPEQPQHPAHLLEPPARGLLDRGQAVPGALGVAVEHVAGAARLHHDGRQAVRHDVVQLAGDPGALGRDRLGGVLVPRLVQGPRPFVAHPDDATDQPHRAEQDRRRQRVRGRVGAAALHHRDGQGERGERRRQQGVAQRRVGGHGVGGHQGRERRGVELQRVRHERAARDHRVDGQGDPEGEAPAPQQGQRAEPDRQQVEPDGTSDDVLGERCHQHLVDPDGAQPERDDGVEREAAGGLAGLHGAATLGPDGGARHRTTVLRRVRPAGPTTRPTRVP